MKKLIFSAFIIAFMGVTCFGQQGQGTITVGGTFNLSFQTDKAKSGSSTTTGDKTTNFTLMPSIEYFFMQDVSLGLGIGYASQKVKHASGNSESDGLFELNPFIRKYWSLGDKVSFFGEGSLLLGFGNYKTEAANTTTYAHSQLQIGIIPGLRYNITNRIALEGTFGSFSYTRDSREQGGDNKSIVDYLKFNVDPASFQLGIRFLLK